MLAMVLATLYLACWSREWAIRFANVGEALVILLIASIFRERWLKMRRRRMAPGSSWAEVA